MEISLVFFILHYDILLVSLLYENNGDKMEKENPLEDFDQRVASGCSKKFIGSIYNK